MKRFYFDVSGKFLDVRVDAENEKEARTKLCEMTVFDMLDKAERGYSDYEAILRSESEV